MLDLDRIASALVAKVREALTPIDQRVAALEQRGAVPGPQGERGIDGADGAKGLDGSDGTNGLDGTDGAAGLPGEVGPMGPQGSAGDRGEKGDTGARGSDGAPGERGEKGEPGVIGPSGERGLDGAPGRDGRDGLSIPGPAGEPGPKGVDGLNGKDGSNGRDAVLKGNIAIKQIDERRYAFCWDDGSPIEVLLADGTKAADIYFAFPIHRDVFQNGTTYERGDMVTWGGHTWHAKTTTTMKPDFTAESSKFWTLAVKAGRDGKGIPGKDGAPGKDGKDGKLLR